MSSRKRRIKRKINMLFKMDLQCKRTYSSYKSNVTWANVIALHEAFLRKGWHKRAMDERHFEMIK